MITVIIAVGVIPTDKEVDSVMMAGAQTGADKYRVPTIQLQGDSLDELKAKAHEYVDKCIEEMK